LAAQGSFEKYERKSKREHFLDAMNEVVPCSRLLALVEPQYPKAGKGRRPMGLEIMLHAYFAQQWFNLSDPGVEDARYDSFALIWVWQWCLTRPPFCASVTYSNDITWAARYWMKSITI